MLILVTCAVMASPVEQPQMLSRPAQSTRMSAPVKCRALLGDTHHIKNAAQHCNHGCHNRSTQLVPKLLFGRVWLKDNELLEATRA